MNYCHTNVIQLVSSILLVSFVLLMHTLSMERSMDCIQILQLSVAAEEGTLQTQTAVLFEEQRDRKMMDIQSNIIVSLIWKLISFTE